MFGHGHGRICEPVVSRRAGETRFVHVVKVPPEDPDGRSLGMQGVFWDVTKSRRDEEAVYRQANLLNMVDDAIVVSDLEGKIQFWNQGAAKIYDLPAAQAIGADVVELLNQDTKEYLNAFRKTCRQDWPDERAHKLKHEPGAVGQIIVEMQTAMEGSSLSAQVPTDLENAPAISRTIAPRWTMRLIGKRACRLARASPKRPVNAWSRNGCAVRG
ncbi:MAG: hypothetical protein CMO80_15720 [Verrucomicrobiales bacterium]|nr:hypothetical protein [Verrucomicrobiales bacterium]